MNEFFSDSLTLDQITRIIVNMFSNSKTIQDMSTAEHYFDLENEEIMKKKRVFRNKKGLEIPNPSAENTKLNSCFLRFLVQQKTDYCFTKEFMLKLMDDKGEVDATSNPLGAEYIAFWNDFIKNKLFDHANSCCTDAVNKGISWTYVWIEDGELNIKDIDPKQIYPMWHDNSHKKLDKLVNNYSVDVYNSENPTSVEYADYWDNNNFVRFNVSENYKIENLKYDDEENPIYAHMTQNGKGVSWERIPFVAFKGNKNETPLINFIKSYVDSYDKLSSKCVDSLMDDMDPLLVISGISPEVNAIIEARELAKMTKLIVLEDGGSASYLQAETNVDGEHKTMQELKHDIYTFGYGVDYDDARFNGNPNMMVIKAIYQNLDTYADGIEKNFQEFINNLKYFVDKYLEFTGKGSFEELQKFNLIVKLDRTMMINQSALIDDAVKLTNTGISKQTQLEFNPVVQDVELEKQRLEEERKENESHAMENMFNFPDDDLGGDNDVGSKEPKDKDDDNDDDK